MSRKHKKQHHPGAKKGSGTTTFQRTAVARPPDVTDFQEEPPEPSTQPGSIPVWLIAIVVLVFYWADMYVVSHGADLGGKGGAFPVSVYDPYKSHEQVVEANPVDPAREMFELGRRTYAGVGCVACHGGGGAGVPGQFPPLAGSEWVLAENPARIIRIVINGLTGPISVAGATYNNTMPPLGSALDAKQVAAVLTYIRNEWGNKAPPVTIEQVEQVKKEIGGRADMFTAGELEQVPLQ
jgi:mono/diheme cytochrome c family protein